MAHEPNAILAISSTDRYINYTNKIQIGYEPIPNTNPVQYRPKYQTNNNQPVNNVLLAQYINDPPYANDFSITAPNALINGYIKKIIISQIQIQYYVPTIVPGRNDTLIVNVAPYPGAPPEDFISYKVILPFGFYTPNELASMLQIQLNTVVYGGPSGGPGGSFSVIYTLGDIAGFSYIGFVVSLPVGTLFTFTAPFYFSTPGDILGGQDNVLRTLKMFGFTVSNTLGRNEQPSYYAPNFLYTPYIDIFSDALTNYQALKDTDSSTIRRKGLLARIYLSGVGNPQITSTGSTGNALGAEPFSLTFDLNSPKVINWTPDTAVNSLDFQVRDCYGDLLFNKAPSNIPGTVGEVFNTEFQMTLLCVEG